MPTVEEVVGLWQVGQGVAQRPLDSRTIACSRPVRCPRSGSWWPF